MPRNLGYVVRVVAFSLIYCLIGVVFPTQQSNLTVGYILGLVVTGFLYAFLLGFVLTRMLVKRRARVFIIWVLIFVIQFFNPMIEGYFFTRLLSEPTLLFGAVFFGAMLSLVYAVVAGFLFVPGQAYGSFAGELKNFFGGRPMFGWIWRVILAALSWMLFYFVFGSLVSPIVTPYYTDPDLGYNLFIPEIETILAVQALRGFIYVGTLLPLLASLNVGRIKMVLAVFGFMYIGGGVATFIIVETFPLMLRIVHGFGDLLAMSLTFTFMVTLLLWKKLR